MMASEASPMKTKCSVSNRVRLERAAGAWITIAVQISRAASTRFMGESALIRLSILLVGGPVDRAMRKVLPPSVALCVHAFVPDGELPASGSGALEACDVAPVGDHDIS